MVNDDLAVLMMTDGLDTSLGAEVMDGATGVNASAATLVMESKVWESIDHDEESVRKSDFATQLIAYALPFVNGMLYVKTKNTQMDGMFLPIIDPAELRSTLKVENIDEKNN